MLLTPAFSFTVFCGAVLTMFSRKISPRSGIVNIVCSSVYSPSRGLQFYCALLHVSRTVDAFTESYYVMSYVSRTSRHGYSTLRLCICTWGLVVLCDASGTSNVHKLIDVFYITIATKNCLLKHVIEGKP